MLNWRASSTVAEGPGITRRRSRSVSCECWGWGGLPAPAPRVASSLARSSAQRLAPRSPRPCSSRPARPAHLATWSWHGSLSCLQLATLSPELHLWRLSPIPPLGASSVS